MPFIEITCTKKTSYYNDLDTEDSMNSELR